MTSHRRFGLSFLAISMLCAAGPAIAGPAEPLVETKLSDPDPGYVPPPAEKRAAWRARNSDENPTLDEAFENLGRVTGQAAQIAQQRVQAEARAAVERARQDGYPH